MKRKTRSREKSDIIINAGLITFMIGLLFRIPLHSIIGKNGIGYFASVNEIFLLTLIFVSGGLAEQLQSTMRYKIKREQFKGAQRSFRCALILAIGLGIVAGLFLLVGSSFI
ncbi:MAG: hypothetical protein LBV33_04760, partial [Lachnospiraceae bacterium]|nr:hypothetical protein [Lachnospiraceae bacterium]